MEKKMVSIVGENFCFSFTCVHIFVCCMANVYAFV